jgi:serine/threonine-protein kinase
MCTGQPPFKADSTVAVLRKVCDEPQRPVAEFNPDVPEWLHAIIAKLMAKDPAQRYQTASEVADLFARHSAELERPALENSSDMPPVAARGRRAPRMLEVVAVLFSLAALTIGLLTWWVVRLRQNARDASVPAVGPPASPAPPESPPAPAPARKNNTRDLLRL